MHNWDLPGWDHLSIPGINRSIDCQSNCDQDTKCHAWTFDESKEVNNNCFLKSGIPLLVVNSACTSGVKQRRINEQIIWIYINRSLSQQNPAAARSPHFGAMWMESISTNEEWFLTLNIYIDHSAIEVLETKSDRVAITSRVYPEEETAQNLAIYVNVPSTTEQNIIIDTLDIWLLNSIWM